MIYIHRSDGAYVSYELSLDAVTEMMADAGYTFTVIDKDTFVQACQAMCALRALGG